MQVISRLRVAFFGALVMLLLVGLVSAAQPAITQAAAPKVTKFYTISKASYDKWVPATSKALPSPTKAFASGTKNVGYFLAYNGAKPKVSTFQIIIYKASGALFIKGDVHKMTYKAGYFANYFYNTPSFPAGTYKMKLLVNGKAVGSTGFSIA